MICCRWLGRIVTGNDSHRASSSGLISSALEHRTPSIRWGRAVRLPMRPEQSDPDQFASLAVVSSDHLRCEVSAFPLESAWIFFGFVLTS